MIKRWPKLTIEMLHGALQGSAFPSNPLSSVVQHRQLELSAKWMNIWTVFFFQQIGLGKGLLHSLAPRLLLGSSSATKVLSLRFLARTRVCFCCSWMPRALDILLIACRWPVCNSSNSLVSCTVSGWSRLVKSPGSFPGSLGGNRPLAKKLLPIYVLAATTKCKGAHWPFKQRVVQRQRSNVVWLCCLTVPDSFMVTEERLLSPRIS